MWYKLLVGNFLEGLFLTLQTILISMDLEKGQGGRDLSTIILWLKGILFLDRCSYEDIPKLRDTFLNCIQSTHKTINSILYSCTFISELYNISFLLFIWLSFSLFAVFICSCMLSMFSIRTLSIRITVVLNSWSDDSKILDLSGLML